MAQAVYIRYISGIEGHEVLAHVRDRHCAAVVGIRGRHISQVGSCSGIKGVTHHTYRSRACQQSPLFEYRSARTIGGVIGSRLEDIFTSGLPEKQTWKQLIYVVVITCLIAVTLYISNLPVPMVFKDTATRIGAVTGPLSMLVIGDSLAQIRLKDLFTDVRLLLFSVVKLLLMPALLLWGLRFFITDPMFLGVCLVMTATPVGSMTVMLAQQYDGDYRLTSKGVALTTVLSVATMPFLFWLLKI